LPSESVRSHENTLGDYLTSIEPGESLISTWTNSSKIAAQKQIEDLSVIIIGRKVIGGKTNQSTGNRFEKLVKDVLAVETGKQIRMIKSGKTGYPDVFLKISGVKGNVAMEIKATSNWNPKDSNRRVLLSSTSRLNEFVTKNPTLPLFHAVVTLEYDALSFTVERVRLHFLQPSSQIQVRLEASTSQKLLSSVTGILFTDKTEKAKK